MRRRPLSAAYRRRGRPAAGQSGSSVVGWYGGRDNQSRRVVAKPVRSRHSPATVSAPRGRESGRRPHGACSNLREKGRQDRAPHRLTPPSTISKRGVACRRDPSDRIPSRRSHPCSRRPARPSREPRRPAGSCPSLAALVLVLAACTGSAGALAVARAQLRRDRDRRADRHAAADPQPATPVPAFPATLTDDEGTSRHDRGRAQEDRLARRRPRPRSCSRLGAGDRVVATDDGSDYPGRGRGDFPHVATFSSVDTEKVVAARRRPRRRRRPRLHAGRRDHQAALTRASRSSSSTRRRSTACSRTSS